MAVIYFFKDSLTRSNVEKIEIKAGTTLQEFLDSRAISANEISAADKKGEITAPGDYIFGPDSCVILTPNLGKNAGKVFKAILGVALLAATGGTAGLLAGLFGGGATGALIVKGLGAALLMDGGGELMMGKMKLGSIDVANETTPQSYTWNVGSLSNSRGLMGLTFGSGVMPEGELLAYRTFGTNTVTTQTHQQIQAYNTWTSQWNNVSRVYSGQKTRTLTIKDNRTVEDDTSVLEMLIGCGEGPLDRIYDIKVNGTPLSELGSDVVCETRLGTNNQSSFGGLVDIDSQLGSLSVGQQVKRSGESDGWSIYTAPVSGNKVKLSLSSNAFYLMDLQSGSKNQAYASLRVEWREADTLNAWTSAGVSGLPATDLPMLSKQPFYINVTIDVGAAAKKIEIRILNDSDQLNLYKGWLSQAEYTQLPDRAQINFMLQNISIFSADERSYPGIGLIYLRIPASQALNGGIPKVSWKQDRANIIAWNGSAYVSRPADNIAWKIYDIICKIRKDEYTNQYHGLGWPVSLVDFSRFEQFAAFCDSINAKGNDFLKKSGAAWDIVQEYATSGRGYISHRMGLIAPYWDAAGQITQIFTSGNMSANSVEGGYALPKERATALNITFNDEANDFRESTVRITADAADDGSEASTVCFPGLSTVAAASAQARYHLRRNRYIRHNISFKAAWDSLVSEVGDIIGIQSDITEWGTGGRILSIDSANTALQLSEPVTMRSGQTYGLLVRKVTGVLGTLEPSHVWVNGQWVTPSAAGTTGDRIKVDTIAGVTVDDVYSFGARNYETKPFRISTISRSVKDGKAVIHAVEYNPALYVDGGSAPIIDYRQQNAGISSLVALTDNADGSIGLAWQPNENTKATQVWVNDRYIANVAGSTFVLPTLSDTQNVKLIPVLSDGTPGEPVTQTLNPNIIPPSAPLSPLASPTPTGVLLTFTNTPQNQGIAYLTVEENGQEIARTAVLGDTVAIVAQFSGGSHQLSAYHLNSFGLKSLPTTFSVSASGIDNGLLQVDCVKANNIEAGAVTTEKLDAGAVTTEKLDAGAVTAEKIDVDDLSALNAKIGGNIITEDGIHSEGYTSGLNGWGINKYGDADFNDVSIRGTLRSVNFEKDTVSTVGGQLMVNASAELQSYLRSTINNQVLQSEDWLELLTEDNQNLLLEQSGQTVYYTITVDDASVLNVKDILRIRNADTVTDLWLVALSKNDNTLVCSMLYGSAMDLSSGMTVVNYGKAGTGGIILDGNAPKMDMFTHDGEPWQRINNHLRMGNLNGFLDYTENQYGIAIGNINAYLKYDPVNSLRIKGNIESTYLTANSENVILGTSANPWMLINSAGATFSGNIKITDNNIQGRNFIEAHGEYANTATDYVTSDYKVSRGSVTLDQRHYTNSSKSTLVSASYATMSPTGFSSNTQRDGKNLTFSVREGTIGGVDTAGNYIVRSDFIQMTRDAGGGNTISYDNGFSQSKDNNNYSNINHTGVSFHNSSGSAYISHEGIQLVKGTKTLFQYSSSGAILIANTANNNTVSIGNGGIGATVDGVYRFKTWAQILG